jgi:hypothetical protein
MLLFPRFQGTPASKQFSNQITADKNSPESDSYGHLDPDGVHGSLRTDPRGEADRLHLFGDGHAQMDFVVPEGASSETT